MPNQSTWKQPKSVNNGACNHVANKHGSVRNGHDVVDREEGLPGLQHLRGEGEPTTLEKQLPGRIRVLDVACSQRCRESNDWKVNLWILDNRLEGNDRGILLRPKHLPENSRVRLSRSLGRQIHPATLETYSPSR
ncbi:hypothetical protein OIY81_3597 [Cryptosporidium canis]|uniref:Uncharacterized protein n=1 Tax=Cryptosporidium canis TaxID=195482 RepID=A0ABQ8P483_9CRYT|nr:hypothetical protein OIY81_3597 [Cryptosporidium canis]KAJ1607695.1 hypothetical protein OJ252_2772 [Cryptosporidium canis]